MKMNDPTARPGPPEPSGREPIYVRDPKLRAALKASYPHLDVREPDGDPESRLVFAKVDSVQQISLPYDRGGEGPIAPEQIRRVGLVHYAYGNVSATRGADRVLSHVSGIDPRRDIVFRRLEPGTIAGCYRSGEYTGTLAGGYVTPDIGATLGELGVPPEWAAEKTRFDLFEVTDEHFVLETTAAPFRGTRGGARQFFLTDPADRRRYRPATFGTLRRPAEKQPRE